MLLDASFGRHQTSSSVRRPRQRSIFGRKSRREQADRVLKKRSLRHMQNRVSPSFAWRSFRARTTTNRRHHSPVRLKPDTTSVSLYGPALRPFLPVASFATHPPHGVASAEGPEDDV